MKDKNGEIELKFSDENVHNDKLIFVYKLPEFEWEDIRYWSGHFYHNHSNRFQCLVVFIMQELIESWSLLDNRTDCACHSYHHIYFYAKISQSPSYNCNNRFQFYSSHYFYGNFHNWNVTGPVFHNDKWNVCIQKS